MAVAVVCPINGCLPPDNGVDQTKANNVVPTGQDTVQAASGVIGSTSGVTVIVASGAAYAINQYIRIRGERMLITGIATNTLTVTRSAKGESPSGTIAIGDFVLTGFDVAGNASHCPICGTAMIVVDPAVILAKTGVATGSQHPTDIDAVYAVNVADANNTQRGTAYSQGSTTVTQHGFPTVGGKVIRGTQVQDINTSAAQVTLDQVTPETVNAVAGP